jgi:hypothetical protein
MDTTKSLLERLRSKYDGCSDYRLAKILGVGKTAVSRYMLHGGGMANDVGMRLADELGLPHAYVVACLSLEREPSDQVKPVWQGIIETLKRAGQTAPAPARARRASKVAAVLLTTGIAALSAFAPRQAQASHAEAGARGLYILSNRGSKGRNRRFAHVFPRRRLRPRRRDFPVPAALPIVAT